VSSEKPFTAGHTVAIRSVARQRARRDADRCRRTRYGDDPVYVGNDGAAEGCDARAALARPRPAARPPPAGTITLRDPRCRPRPSFEGGAEPARPAAASKKASYPARSVAPSCRPARMAGGPLSMVLMCISISCYNARDAISIAKQAEHGCPEMRLRMPRTKRRHARHSMTHWPGMFFVTCCRGPGQGTRLRPMSGRSKPFEEH